MTEQKELQRFENMPPQKKKRKGKKDRGVRQAREVCREVRGKLLRRA